MGALPIPFDGNRERADDFIEELKAYIRLNQGLMASYIKRVALTLTLLKGPLVASWAKDMGVFYDTLVPADDVPDLWEQFLGEFARQFQDSQKSERARVKLQSLRMTWPNIDQYIADFEQLARDANYTIGNSETIQFFIARLPRSVAEDVMKPPLVHHYSDIKDRAIQSLRSRQIIEQIFGNRRFPTNNRGNSRPNFFPQRQQGFRPPYTPRYQASGRNNNNNNHNSRQRPNRGIIPPTRQDTWRTNQCLWTSTEQGPLGDHKVERSKPKDIPNNLNYVTNVTNQDTSHETALSAEDKPTSSTGKKARTPPSQQPKTPLKAKIESPMPKLTSRPSRKTNGCQWPRS